jgi:SAM-dependent methyltransferase
VFEQAYLASDDPRAQSGFSGDEARWESARRPILEAIDHAGTFLDVGCANGYLLESIVRWSEHRIEPYGLDFTPALVELARRRLPQWADRIFVGDALTWERPRSFDYVRTELVYVPAERRRELVERLRSFAGRVIVCSYGSRRRGLPADDVGAELRSLGFGVLGEVAREGLEGALIHVAWM